VNLIDEKNYIMMGFKEIDKVFDTLFSITSVRSTSNESIDIKNNYLEFFEFFGTVTAVDIVSEFFDKCGFTDTRLTNDNGVSLVFLEANIPDRINFFVSTKNFTRRLTIYLIIHCAKKSS
jgi:hypothetical protein